MKVVKQNSQYNDALARIGGLSKPSKMPGYGWSIPAKDCITGSKLRPIPGSVCASCYALKGRYIFPNVQAAMERRLHAWRTNPSFVSDFIEVLSHVKGTEFRWFDSGDLQSTQMLTDINAIALGVPSKRFWLPTRELKIVREWKRSGNVPAPNLFIKISFPMVGGRFDTMPDGLSFSTVGRDDDTSLWQCPARLQGNSCGSCRACWSTTNVNYHAH